MTVSKMKNTFKSHVEQEECVALCKNGGKSKYFFK